MVDIEFNANNVWFWVIIGAVIVFLIAIIVTHFVVIKIRNPQQKGLSVVDENSWKKYLGGADNIKEVEVKLSRIIVKLNDYDRLNADALHELGALSVIKSQDKVTIVVPGSAKLIADKLK